MDKVQAINRDYYDANAERWAETKTHTFYSEKEFRTYESYLKPGARILDIGCGYGRDVPLFLGIGRKFEYEGLDISATFIDIASSRYPQLKFHKGNLLERETLPRGYDGFWAAATLQHIPERDWPAMLDNLELIMNSGAIAYFSLPNDRPNPPSEKDPRYFSIIDDGQVKEWLQERGWNLLEEGVLPGTRSTTVWRWYIYTLPE